MSDVLPFHRGAELEWIGARYTLPEPVRDGDAVYRPEVVLWLELPGGLLIGSVMCDAQQPTCFADAFRQVMSSPAEGPPRRPTSIRVPDARFARELRASVGGIPIVVAPVPELDEVFDALSDALVGSRPELSYLAGGAISADAVAELFCAATELFRSAPWRDLSDQQIVRVDIPAYDIDGACLSVIGAAGESFGLLLFRSLEDFDAFGEEMPREGDGKVAMRSLSFELKKNMPPSMLREIKQHRWTVRGASAYPAVFSVDAALQPLPTTERDLRILTACARAFLPFFERHRNVFEDAYATRVQESIAVDAVTVTLTAPYGAAETELETVHQMDFRLVNEMAGLASAHFGPDWLGFDIERNSDALALLLPWATWTRVGAAFVEANAQQLSSEERDWCAAQRAAWLSIWEVTHVEPGLIVVRDLLTNQERSVREELASRSVAVLDALLTRIVDYRGASYFGGMHGRPLPPDVAASVFSAVRKKLRVPKRDVAVKRLQDGSIGWFLIGRWTDAAAGVEAAP